MKTRALVVAHKDAPFERQELELEEPGRDIEQALADSQSGRVIKPVLRISEA